MQAEDKRNQIVSWFRTPKPSALKRRKETSETEKETSETKNVGGCAFVFFYVVIYGLCALVAIFILRILNEKILDSRYISNDSIETIVGWLAIIFVIITVSRHIVKEKKEKTRIKAEAAKAEAEAKAKYDARPSTHQMVQWLKEDLEILKENSLHKTGLDESEIVAEPLLVETPILERVLAIETEHGYYLSTVWDINILYISEKSVILYQCRYNWERDEPLSESTTEYYYREITTVTRISEERDQIIRISMNNGSWVELNLNWQGYADPSSYVDKADKAVQSIRRLLKS